MLNSKIGKCVSNLKDGIPVNNMSIVEYSVKCVDCKLMYIGHTGRSIKNELYQ